MNFAKDLVKEENVTTSSGVSFLEKSSSKFPSDNAPKENTTNKEKDVINHVSNLLIDSANKAASDLFLSTGSKIYSTIKEPLPSSKDPYVRKKVDNLLVDCKLYPSKLLPPSSVIESNNLVVVFESFDSLDFVYVKSGDVFHNRNGHFHHDDFIGKPYGCKIRSRNNRGMGFVYLLKPTPELWARSLNHRTQIVHELDAAMVVFNLNLRPNMVVCESGTGSGAMSHCIMRAIAPHGTLHTYEFNEMRAKTAMEEFERNGVDHLVNVHWRDVCGKPIKAGNSNVGNDSIKADDGDNQLSFGSGGFDIGQAAAHAIFLDLPEPWLAIPHAAHAIKPNGTICSYSPCMEQTQKTSQAMREYGFHSIKTIEVRLREHYVDKVELDNVPTTKLARDINVNNYVPGMSPPLKNKEENTKNASNSATKSIETDDADKKLPDSSPSKKRKLLCARPFATMRGHSAFLTFANAGNKAFPDPSRSYV